MLLVKDLGTVDGIISIKTHLEGAFGFSGILDLAFLFVEEIWHYVKKGSGYVLRYTSPQILALSPANNDLVDLWHNLWSNNSKAIFLLDGKFFVFDISLISHQNECFVSVLGGNVTDFSLLLQVLTVQNPFWK